MSNMVGYYFICMGLAMLGYLLVLRIKAGRAMSWPSVRGEIIESRVTKECAGPSTSCHMPIITYRYTVKGETFESNRVFIGRQALSHELRANKIMDKFPPGTETSVYYDPDNPKAACLVRKIDNPRFIMKFGIVLVVVGLMFLGGVFGT